MAVKTKQQIIDDATTFIPDNQNHEISAEDIRQRIIDIVDSAVFTGNQPDLAEVALSGSYNDLIDKPVYATVANTGSYNDLTNKPTLATVASTGQYVDLINKPVLATVATSGSYNDLTNKPALATVATSGSYNDLIGKPTLGSAAAANTSDFVPATRSLGAGFGLTGGGDLTANRSYALSPTTQASLIKADNAIAYNVKQTLTSEQQSYARANVGTDFLNGYRNKFINGRLDFWQRGNSQTASGFRSSDRWAVGIGGTGTAVTWSREPFPMGDTQVPGNTETYGRMVISDGGDATNGLVNIYHSIENVRTCAGKEVTVTFWARNPSSSIPLKMALSCYQIFGQSGTPSPRVDTPVGVITLPADNTFHRYDVVFTVPSVSGKIRVAGQDMVGIEFIMSAGSAITRGQGIGIQTGDFHLARFSFVEGDARHELDPFSERPYVVEQLMCWRFYRVIRLQWSGMGTNGNGYYARDTLYPPMRAIPTATSNVTSQVGFNTSSTVAVSAETVVVNAVCNSTINNAEYTIDVKLDAEI